MFIRADIQRVLKLVEYAFLLTFFAVPVMAGLTAASLMMLDGYRNTRKHLLAPFP